MIVQSWLNAPEAFRQVLYCTPVRARKEGAIVIVAYELYSIFDETRIPWGMFVEKDEAMEYAQMIINGMTEAIGNEQND